MTEVAPRVRHMAADIETAAGVREGDVLAGKYRVERVLGVGGMGVVVAAHHIQLDQKVAIKFVLPAMLDNADVVNRFAREARAAVRIKSENVARVFDVGTLENGAPYMVMEFLEGGDLAALVHQHGRLPVEQAVDFVLQASVAVAEAHSLGIVHRDLKPSNLYCIRGPDGQLSIKVLDFGISKVIQPSSATSAGSMTATSTIMGSPFYMSPEQMTSPKEVDARSDIWALGVVLFQLLTGRVPFEGETPPEVCVKIATKAPPPLRDFRPEVPEGLETVVATCLEKNRGKRYGNVAEMAVALLPFASRQSKGVVDKIAGIVHAAGLSPTTASTPPPDSGVPRLPTQTVTPVHTTVPGARRKKVAAIGIVATIGAAAVVAVAAVQFGRIGGPGTAGTKAPLTATPPPSGAPLAPPAEKPEILAPVEPAPEALGANGEAPVPAASDSERTVVTTKPHPPTNVAATPKPPQVLPAARPTVARPSTNASSKPDCDPNYYYDADGHKRFKHECFPAK